VAGVELKAENSESWIPKDGERSRNVFWNQHDRLSGSVTIPDLAGAARAALKKKMLKMRFKATMLLKTQENAFGTKPFFGFKAILGRELSAAMLLETNKPALIQKSCLWFEAIFEVQSH
jgi:hypothetical protein